MLCYETYVRKTATGSSISFENDQTVFLYLIQRFDILNSHLYTAQLNCILTNMKNMIYSSIFRITYNLNHQQEYTSVDKDFFTFVLENIKKYELFLHHL